MKLQRNYNARVAVRRFFIRTLHDCIDLFEFYCLKIPHANARHTNMHRAWAIFIIRFQTHQGTLQCASAQIYKLVLSMTVHAL